MPTVRYYTALGKHYSALTDKPVDPLKKDGTKKENYKLVTPTEAKAIKDRAIEKRNAFFEKQRALPKDERNKMAKERRVARKERAHFVKEGEKGAHKLRMIYMKKEKAEKKALEKKVASLEKKLAKCDAKAHAKKK